MRIDAFSRTYEGRCVLRVPDLDLADGAVTAVIGANGSGKTTLARVLAGVEPPDRRGWRRPEQDVGYLPQKPYAFRMSTEKNLLLGGKDPARAAQLMEALDLRALARQSARRLSGGETAKMALARLLMRDFKLLILDEPTASMDRDAALAAEDLIRVCRDRTGCTVLLITHSLRQARRVSDRILFLHKGKLLEQGPTEELLRSPAQPETKSFLDFCGV